MRNLYYIISLLLLPAIASSCISSAKITSVVEKNNEGNFLLKWEVNPYQEGKIDIYSSLSDSSIQNFMPVTTSKIEDQVLLLNPMGSGLREFFILKAGNAYSGIVSNRIIEMNSIKNFRDLGGYFIADNKQMKWGIIYRSGNLTDATLYDQERIRRLGIKTVIDFRSEKSMKSHPLLLHPSIRKVLLPITPMDAAKLDEQMKDEDFNRSDAIKYVQESYVGIVENYKKEFSELFVVLTNEGNYPVLLSGSLGKDRVGLASYFILYALGVPEYIIEDDYLLSNATIDILKVVYEGKNMPEYTQEAVTAMLSVNKAYINYAMDHIKNKYGSIDNYLEKELNVTRGKKALLRKYLLYPY